MSYAGGGLPEDGDYFLVLKKSLLPEGYFDLDAPPLSAESAEEGQARWVLDGPSTDKKYDGWGHERAWQSRLVLLRSSRIRGVIE